MAASTPKFRVILCGEYGSGKTSIFRRFIGSSFEPSSYPNRSKGMDHSSRSFCFNGQDVIMELWDTAGLERFSTLSGSYYKGAHAAVVCFALDNRESFNALSQHLLEVVVHTKTAKIFLCGTKSDISADEIQVTDVDIDNFKFQCDTVLAGCFKISSKSGQGLDSLLGDIVEVLAKDALAKEKHVRMRQPGDLPEAQSEKQKGCC